MAMIAITTSSSMRVKADRPAGVCRCTHAEALEEFKASRLVVISPSSPRISYNHTPNNGGAPAFLGEERNAESIRSVTLSLTLSIPSHNNRKCSTSERQSETTKCKVFEPKN